MQQNKKTPNRYHRNLLTFLVTITVAWTSLNLVIPDSTKSALENRPLAQMPNITLTGVLDGKDQKAFEEAMSDQFVGRNLLFRINYTWRKLIGQKQIDDVYLGKDALLQKPANPNDAIIQQTLSLISQLEASTGISTSVLVAPSAANIQSYKLPAHVNDNGENATLDTIYSQLAHPADPRAVFK